MAALVPAASTSLLLQGRKNVDARHIGVQCTPSFRTAVAGHDAEGAMPAPVSLIFTFQTAKLKQPISNSQASSPVLFGEAPGRPVFPLSPLKDEGDGALGGATIVLCVPAFPLGECGAPLGAPSRRLSYGAGPPFVAAREHGTASVSQAPGGRLLLAARRSPDAARVRRALRGTPRAPHPIPPRMTPHEPLGGPNGVRLYLIIGLKSRERRLLEARTLSSKVQFGTRNCVAQRRHVRRARAADKERAPPRSRSDF